MSVSVFWVICSCGRRTLLHCPRHGICSVEDPTWRYHSDPDVEADEDNSRLWHCGREGHYQAAVADYSAARNSP
jgi:hypothetical protein